ncbi:MAG: hypothetical protein Q9193_004021 [Seirophora villosa]
MSDTASHQITLSTGPLVNSSTEPEILYTVVQKIAAASHKIDFNRELASNTLTEVDITYPILGRFAENHIRTTFILGGMMYNVLHELAEANNQRIFHRDPFSYTLTGAATLHKVLHELAEAYNQTTFNRDPSSHTWTEANILDHVVQELQAPSHQIASDWGPPCSILTEADILYVVLLRGTNSLKPRNPFSYILDRVTSLHALLHPANSSTRLSAKKRMSLLCSAYASAANNQKEEEVQFLYKTKSVVKYSKKTREDTKRRKEEEYNRRNEPRPELYPEDEVIWLPRFHTEQLKAAYTTHRKEMRGKYAALFDTLKGDSVIVHHKKYVSRFLSAAAFLRFLKAVTHPEAPLPENRVGRYVGDDDEAVGMLRSALASRKENLERAGTGSREKKGTLLLTHEEGLEMKAEGLEMKAKVLDRKVELARKGKFWKT